MGTRRSRMKRTGSGRRIEVSERDLEIFRLLTRYRYLRSPSIPPFVGGRAETRFKERLGDLFHEGDLDRPGAQWEFAGARYSPAVYERGNGSQKVLEAVGVDAVTFLRATPHRQFLHSLF